LSHRAFSLLDLVVAMIVLIVVLVIVAVVALRHLRSTVQQNYDQMQVRGVQHGMAYWAGSNQDQYPLPSSVDHWDTIPGINTTQSPQGRFEKDLPRWVFSMLIYNGHFGPEGLVALGEVNPLIRPNASYEYKDPTAVAPALRSKAVLDPSFAAYPDEPGGDTPIKGYGGIAPTPSASYALLAFAGARRTAWQSTSDSTQAVVANRGPWYSQDAAHKWSLNTADRRGAKNIPANESNTLRIHGSRTSWEGNVARNDGSVNFETRPDPENIPMLFVEPGSGRHYENRSRYDNLFANENEDSETAIYSSGDDDITEATNSRRNNYLRCFGDRAVRRFDEKTGALVALGGFWYD
jgi:hypothetical protein